MKNYIGKFERNVLQMSYWAKGERSKARRLIILFQIVKACLGIFAGLLLTDLGMKLSGIWLALPLVVGVLLLLFYPASKSSQTWRRRKISDGLLVLCGLAIWIGIGTQVGTIQDGLGLNRIELFATQAPEARSNQNAPSSSPILFTMPAPEILSGMSKPTQSNSSTLLNATDLQHIGNSQLLSQDKEANVQSKQNQSKERHSFRLFQRVEMEMGLKILLLILAIVATLTLGYVVAALACSISCSGYEVLGTIVLILGWGGLLTGLVLLIRHLFRRQNM